MNSFTLTRGDWSLTNFVLFVVLVISAIPLIGIGVDIFTGAPLQIETRAVVPPPEVVDPLLGTGVSGVYTGDAIFTITDPSATQWLNALVIPLVTFVVAVVCLWQVRKLITLSRRGDPFNPRSLLGVRIMGLLLFTYGLFRPLVELVMMASITTEMRGEFNLAFGIDLASGWPLVVGLVVGVVGEAVFGRGRELADDADGLV